MILDICLKSGYAKKKAHAFHAKFYRVKFIMLLTLTLTEVYLALMLHVMLEKFKITSAMELLEMSQVLLQKLFR